MTLYLGFDYYYLAYIIEIISGFYLLQVNIETEWPGVDTSYFRHWCTDFGHTNLGLPKFNPY